MRSAGGEYSPCQLVVVEALLRPFRAVRGGASYPRALPWAILSGPYRPFIGQLDANSVSLWRGRAYVA